ncbi:MAG: SDR family oxidoreductase [Acidimicrobiales bacterium]|nr:SDR family oxidoreductase [Acidimicrobiales bacterium]
MILDRFRVDGQVAVVTGAGRGIGATTAVALAEAGADVLIAARSEEQLAEVAGQITDLGRRAHVVVVDLNDLDAAAALAETAEANFGRLDIVVNNVGGTVPRPFEHTSTRYLEAAFHFNVSTAHALTRAAVPVMLRSTTSEVEGGRAAGSIVNISSVIGRLADRGYIAYGTAKAALAHWTRLAATDLSPHIRVNGIAVGSVMTSALEMVAGSPELLGKLEANTPLGRIGEPEDIAAAVVYLSSKAGGYLTGKVLEVDGGLQIPNFSLGLPDLEPTPGAEGE